MLICQLFQFIFSVRYITFQFFTLSCISSFTFKSFACFI